MGQILQVNDLHVYYGSIHAVKGVSFEVNEGEVVTLIGANGAGKSTVLNTVSGLLHPKHGSVVFEGLKGRPRAPDRRARSCAGSGRPPRLFADDGRG